jgi:type VI secretion system secreted protein VgrG
MQEELGRLFSIHAELLSLQENIKFEDLLGTNVTIRLNLAGDEKRFFNGHITQIAQTGNEGAYAVYEATIHPWLWFLTRTADCRIFQNQTVPDIIKAVFRDLGYTDFKEKLSNTYPTWEYCVQYRETDFNFVSRLMEQEGIYYYFQHQDGKHELVLSDSYSSHQPLPGVSKIPFYPPDEATVREEESCSRWYLAKQVLPGKYVLNDFDFKRPSANLQVNATVVRTHAVADYEVYDYPGEYQKIDAGDGYVQTRLQELHSGYEQAHGQSDVRAMQTGCLFTLLEHPRDDQNREYLVTSATHTIHSDVFEGSTAAKGQDLYSNSFSAIDSKTPFRPARTTPKPHIRGPQTAIVVGPSGEEIHTDEHGRVKLQFHWDRYGKSDENSSCWVRVSQVWAGKNWGAMHIPRIGQEVIVEFLEGDPDRPIITGRVYNGEQIPPYGLPANKTQSGVKSRSSKGGSGANFNEIRMEDKKGAEQLYVHAEKNQDNIVENDETTSVGHDRTETVGHNETISIGHDRTEIVANNEQISIGNNRTEQVAVNETIAIGFNRSVTIGMNKTETIAINKAETIGAAKELTIGGLYQVSVGAVMNETVALAKTQEVGATKSTTVAGDVSENYNSSQSTSVANDHTESIGKNQTLSIGENQTIQVGKNLTIEVGDQIVIQTGKASITLKKDGTIQISGKDITINGSGKIDVKASNNITMKGQKILQN